jgi:hypothetical protein
VPRNARIGNLLHDFSFPFFCFAGDLSAPHQALIVQLFDLHDAIHEHWDSSNCDHWSYAVPPGTFT